MVTIVSRRTAARQWTVLQTRPLEMFRPRRTAVRDICCPAERGKRYGRANAWQVARCIALTDSPHLRNDTVLEEVLDNNVKPVDNLRDLLLEEGESVDHSRDNEQV